MSINPPESDGGLAQWLAARAGELLLAVRAEHGYADPAALKAAGDRASHEFLLAELERWRPTDTVLSEEDDDSRRSVTEGGGPTRLNADRVWIVDPLDGTREFSEEGRSDWAVHVALWHRHASTPHRLIAGAVGLPAQGRVLTTEFPLRSRTDQAGDGPIRLAASRSRPPAFLTDLAEEIGAELVPMGSAGAKIAAVVTGEVDAYIHAGGQYEWDSAAPVAVATAAGFHACRIDGTALRYNEVDPRLPDLLVCRPDLAAPLLEALSRQLSTAAAGTAAPQTSLLGKESR
ncbi:3'(2'),5'-bisphosphate nucleotidase CysQ [Micromonospora echinospora]|uniref:3'(2'),5-bisphosphonucleoside 3'(2')-phosphohydrolase n=1 Tax=Micromonospora echinospora TaxID=1877 RepID=A0A1C4VJ21_MICEC|nr:3'(2'),5'-bisphosphate nucleotidase CysQ [Micromonospora echinospora]OZV72068.1 3'(2'),5'-bisphosphate nucleotidase CysQ [Micromonospora echinospora]SCE83966.1 3'(2'),5'-bisphosphate nucleotidase [Micromonospora echinospora]